MGKNGPNILLISDQVMLKAANQVLFQTVRGLLGDGYRICLVLDGNTGHEAGNVASLQELFPQDLDRLELHYFNAYGGAIFSALKKIRAIITKIKQGDSRPDLTSFAPSNTIKGFDKTRTGCTFISDFKYELKWLSAFKIAEKVAAVFKPDLICGFEIGGAVPAEKLAKRLGIPFYTKYMGTIVHPYIEDGTLDRVKPYVKGLSVKSAMHFMLNDGTKGDVVQKFLGVDPETIRFRIDGVDKHKYRDLPSREKCIQDLGLPIKNDDFLCLCLSNHNAAYKRLDRAIRAVAELSKKYASIKLILVGNGANTNALKALAIATGQGKNIIFLPKLKHEQIPLILTAANVYLNTNDVSNLSHPVLEAMICGTTVVSMSDGSLDGIVANCETGLLVNPNQCSTELPEAIEALYCDRRLLTRLADRAKVFADESFLSWDEKNRIELDEIRALLADQHL